MKAEIIKDWEHIKAPKSSTGKRIYKKGSTVNISNAEYIDGVRNGYVLDPDNPPKKKSKKEKSTAKEDKETR